MSRRDQGPRPAAALARTSRPASGGVRSPRAARPSSELPAPASRARRLALAAALAIVTVAAFAGALDHTFVDWDDMQYVVQNPVVLAREPLGLMRAVVETQYHPLTLLSLAMNVSTPLSARPFIATSIALHVADTLLVFWLMWLVTGRRAGVAAAVALLFGIHPLHVESVAWVSGRKDVLYAFWFLAGLIAYWRYLETGTRDRLWLAFGCSVLACLAKPMAIVFPGALVLLDAWRRRPLLERRALAEKLPFVLVAAATALVAVHVQNGGDLGGLLVRLNVTPPAAGLRSDLPLVQRVTLPLYGPMIIAWRMLVPLGLCANYPFPDAGEALAPRFLIAPLAVLAMAALAAWDARRSRIMTFGFGWYLLHLAPTLPFVLLAGFITADRYSYLSSLGLLFAAAMGMDALRRRAAARRRALALGLAGLLAAFTVWLFVLTRRQVEVWRDSETLWTHALASYPRLAPAYVYRGKQRALAGRNDEALGDFRAALALGLGNADVYQGLGALYGTRGALDSALVLFDRAVELEPRRAGLYYNRAITRLALGRAAEAVADLDRALALAPGSPELHAARGHARSLAGDPRGAVADLDRAIAAGRDDVANRYQRGLSRLAIGDRQGAADDFRRVLRLDPTHAGARERLQALGG